MLGLLKRMFRPGNWPEPAPQGWDQLGQHPAYTVRRFATQDELDAEVVRRGLGSDRTYARNRRARAAVDPKTFEYLKLDPSLYAPGEEAEVDKHEGAHMFGLVHKPSGREWLSRDGQPVSSLSAPRAGLMRAMAQGEAQQRNALRTETVNALKGGR